jgi:hypothetical protein
MAQHDYNIANQTAANARTDINNVLSAIATNNSGSSAPSTTFANMWWYDTSNNILKIRAEGNDAWISVAYLDQTGDNFRILDDTQVVNTSGTQTGLLGDQATATWETGTGTTESLVSPAKVAASATEVVGDYAIGVGQTWQSLAGSRALNTTYQNTTGRPISVSVVTQPGGSQTSSFEVSPNSDMSSSVVISRQKDINGLTTDSGIIPNNIYYRLNLASGFISSWAELR